MRSALRLILVSALAVCVGGCETPYQPLAYEGGFSETRFAEDAFRVNFWGNGFTSEERTQDFVMLRASELTLENGFKYFRALQEETATTVSTFTTPGSSQTTGSAYLYGGRGNYYGNYSERTTYTPPQTHYVVKPGSVLVIQCFREKPEELVVFDATFLRDSIRSKYKMK